MYSLLLATPKERRAEKVRAVLGGLPRLETTLETTGTLSGLLEAEEVADWDLLIVDAAFGAAGVQRFLGASERDAGDPPAVVLLAACQDVEPERWIRAGADDCLSASTLTPERVGRVVRRTLARAEQGGEKAPTGRLYKALVQNSLDIITVLDEEAKIRYESPSVRTLGYEPEDLLGRDVFQFVHEDDLEAVTARFAEAVREPGYTTSIELRFRHGNGSWRTLESRAQNLLENPDVQGVIVNSRDITERKRVEEALRHSEAHTRALLHAMPDAMARISGEGTYLDVQLPEEYPAAAEPKQIQGASLSDVLPPEIAEQAKQSVTRALETGETQRFEYAIEVGGEERFRESRVVAADENEVLAVQRDITERKRSERALRRSRERLRDLNTYLHSVREEERTRISREVHDALGQKLTSLRMDLTWLRRDLDGEGTTHRLDEMEERIDATIRTVRRISSELRPGLLDDVGLAAAVEWQTRQFESRYEIPCTLTLPSGELELKQDLATDLFRLFQEALTNVARHAEASSVEVGLARRDDSVVLRVADDGRGIREEEVDDLTSLGLLGMRERANSWDGTVTFDAQADDGTTVTVRVPLVPSDSTSKKDHD